MNYVVTVIPVAKSIKILWKNTNQNNKTNKLKKYLPHFKVDNDLFFEFILII